MDELLPIVSTILKFIIGIRYLPTQNMIDPGMLEQSEKTSIGQVVRGSSARKAATLMDYGNIIAIVFIPLLILWFGASMLVYAMNRHHPNPKVGHYTQWAAYRFYGITGFFVAAATFIPGGGLNYYLIAWALAALVLIPWSILDLIRIYKDEWVDIVIDDDGVNENHDTPTSNA